MTRSSMLLVITATILFNCSPRVDKEPSTKGPAQPAKSYVKSELVVDPGAGFLREAALREAV